MAGSQHQHPERLSPSVGVKPRRWLWFAIALPLIPLVLAFGMPLLNGLFPQEEIVACTIEEKSSFRNRKAGRLLPNLPSDCGGFRSPKEVTCTSDQTQQLALIPGFTYDLVVRGPRLPLIGGPNIVSATVSPQQRYPYAVDVTEVDESASEALQELQRSLLPETLRAFDYEQPPYDPQCDLLRGVMTTKGIQLVPAQRAEELLTPPQGVQAREPKLPCRGYQCSPVG